MLYPKQDKGVKRLLLSCRHCGHDQEANDKKVYRNVIKKLADPT